MMQKDSINAESKAADLVLIVCASGCIRMVLVIFKSLDPKCNAHIVMKLSCN